MKTFKYLLCPPLRDPLYVQTNPRGSFNLMEAVVIKREPVDQYYGMKKVNWWEAGTITMGVVDPQIIRQKHNHYRMH